MALSIIRLDHVQITVTPSREEQTKDFYGRILGLHEIEKPENLKRNGGAWYRLGTNELHVSVEEEAENLVSRRHVCYVVENLEEAEQELRSAGVEIIPDKQPIEDWIRFYVRDPGDNRVEIAQRT